MIAVIVIVTPVCAYLITMGQSSVYEASADVVIGTSSSTIVPGIGQSADAERTAATQQRLARLPAVARQVIASQGLQESASEFLGHSSVSVTSGADILTFSDRSSNSAQAVQLASAYARAFVGYRTTVENGAIAVARHDLRGRINRLKASGASGSALYRALVARDEQLAAAEVLPDLGAVVVQPAVDAAKVGPHPARNTALGIGLGLLLAIGAAFLAEALNPNVRSAEEIEERLGRPVLGRLPPGLAAQSAPLMMISNPANAAAESVRMLRATFDFARLESGAKSVMFTEVGELGAQPAVAANLAVALARAGRNVILWDLDCRNPSFADLFDLRDRPGVTDVALKGATLADALAEVRTEIGELPGTVASGTSAGSLHVLPLGTLVPASPADFVGSRAVADIAAALSAQAEVVLIEAPPLLSVSDAAALSSGVDAIVLETWGASLRRDALVEADRALSAFSAPLLGVIILETQSNHAASEALMRFRPGAARSGL